MSSKQPTTKQKRAVELLVESSRDDNDKPKAMGTILKEAGYSEGTAIKPSQVTNSDGFQLALEQAGVTDERLSRVVDEGLSADKPMGKNDKLYPDYSVRHKYLETSLRMKGLVKDKETNDIYNTYVQYNNLNPNSVDSKELVNNMVDYLMEQTKAK